MIAVFEQNVRPPESAIARIWLVVIGVSALGLLLTARCLEPSPEGVGTHRELGLPPCGFLVVYGWPCPSCGMTTSWAHLTRGHVVESAKANPGGMLLGMLAFVTGSWMLVSGIGGRWFIGFPSSVVIITGAVLIIATTAIHWIVRLTI